MPFIRLRPLWHEPGIVYLCDLDGNDDDKKRHGTTTINKCLSWRARRGEYMMNDFALKKKKHKFAFVYVVCYDLKKKNVLSHLSHIQVNSLIVDSNTHTHTQKNDALLAIECCSIVKYNLRTKPIQSTHIYSRRQFRATCRAVYF